MSLAFVLILICRKQLVEDQARIPYIYCTAALTIIVYYHIFGLEITMCHLKAMQEIHSSNQLTEIVTSSAHINATTAL